MVLGTGWTWEYVWENMTFKRLAGFQKIWDRTPPHHISLSNITELLKAFMGVHDKAADKPVIEPPFMNEDSDIED